MTATLMGGLGSASLVTASGHRIGALVAVNAFGEVTWPEARAFLAGALEIGEEFGGLGPVAVRLDPVEPRGRKPRPENARGNTTIGIVATDAALDKAAAQRMAEVAHDGLARAVHPAHTPFDGDLVFAVSTGAKQLAAPEASAQMVIEHAAAVCLARAIARAVYAARPAPGNLLPCWCQLAAD
jgi:D-aminopeptidase